MKYFRELTLAAAFAVCIAAAAFSQNSYKPTWESLDSRPTPQWFDDAKFGIFIHWGVYSVPAWGPKSAYAEWYWHALLEVAGPSTLSKYTKNPKPTPTMEFHNKTFGKDFKYQDFAPMFKAELFNPDEWAAVFAKSGAKYVVLTSKHHEGFCLWPSEYSWNWNAMDIGPHRDLAGDLTKSVRNAGLKMGFYYSLYEWYNPQYLHRVNDYVDQHMIPQMKELVTKYKPSVLWTDGEWDYPSDVWKSKEFLAWLFNESPSKDDIVIDDRWGSDTRMTHGGVYTSEYGGTGGGKKVSLSHKWEENQGIGRSFGYNRNEAAADYKTSEQLIHMLIDTVSRGGNLLLDVGPTADGRIPDIMQQRLLDIGDWLQVNGEAIYGTRPWRVQKDGDSVFYTSKGDTLYAICTKWPETELALAAPAPGGNTTVTLLGSDAALKWSAKGGKLIIASPQLSPDAVPSRYAYVFKLTGVK